MKKLLITLYICAAFLPAFTQQVKLSFPVVRKMQETENQQKLVALLVKGNERRIEEITQQQGGVFKYSRNGISSIMIPLAGVSALAADIAVTRIEDGAPRLQLMGNDTMRYMNRIMDIHNGVAPLPKAYTGKGVMLGFIDTGIDYTHPDFQDATGKTRIKFIWDHLLADSANTPMPYAYGQEFTGADIDSGRATAHHDQGVHGTVITGMGGGNGNATGEFTGAAPEADLVIVAINFNVGDDQFLSSIADAVDYIYAKADAAGQPCIINISAGTYYGSHDGNDLSTQLMDGLITAKNGRSIVCASGNAGGFALHTHTTVATGDTVFTWFKNAGAQSYCEFWGDTANMSNLKFTIGADKFSPDYEFRGSLTYTNIQQQLGTLHTNVLYSVDGNKLATVQSYADIIGGQYGMFYLVTRDSTYNWRLQTTGTGSWDGYTFDWIPSSLLPTATVYPAIADYVAPDLYQNMCSGFQCSDKTITVGQYTNMNSYTDFNNTIQSFTTTTGAIHPTSSWGPTRDLRQKPDVVASSEWTFGPLIVTSQPWFIANQPYKIPPTAKHLRANGTSGASAIVSGIVAMYLEKYPFASSQDIKNAIINCSYTDSFTGASLPDYKWGHGKTDAFSMITNCGVTGIGENSGTSENIYCFPNPSDKTSILNFPALATNSILQIHDCQGRLIKTLELKKASSSCTIDVTSFQSGIYYLTIGTNDGKIKAGKLLRY